jgi:hypothetical protein
MEYTLLYYFSTSLTFNWGKMFPQSSGGYHAGISITTFCVGTELLQAS